jgi:hypothetical protein
MPFNREFDSKDSDESDWQFENISNKEF